MIGVECAKEDRLAGLCLLGTAYVKGTIETFFRTILSEMSFFLELSTLHVSLSRELRSSCGSLFFSQTIIFLRIFITSGFFAPTRFPPIIQED